LYAARGRGWTGATPRTCCAGLPRALCGRGVCPRSKCSLCIGMLIRPLTTRCCHASPSHSTVRTISLCVRCCCRCCSTGNVAVLSSSSGGTGSLVPVDAVSAQFPALCQVDWLCPAGHACDLASQTKVRTPITNLTSASLAYVHQTQVDTPSRVRALCSSSAPLGQCPAPAPASCVRLVATVDSPVLRRVLSALS
jgi:hypothetical protein